MAVWIKSERNKAGFLVYPYCSKCHYFWKEQVIGLVGEGESDICEAKYCPNCGEKMEGVTNVVRTD